MRLSEKGCVHLNEWAVHKLPIDAFEFKPEDFTGAIVLTIEEAKRLVEHLRLCEVSVNDPFYASDCDAWALDLSCRIEQAEKDK